jgi:hypothetical protein
MSDRGASPSVESVAETAEDTAEVRAEARAELAALVALEGLAVALRATDPERALAALALRPELSRLRGRIASISGDGFRLSALLVARLRFERLVQGSDEASAWFDRDPAGFAAAFRRYHAEVPASALFPADEAELFLRWCDGAADS